MGNNEKTRAEQIEERLDKLEELVEWLMNDHKYHVMHPSGYLLNMHMQRLDALCAHLGITFEDIDTPLYYRVVEEGKK